MSMLAQAKKLEVRENNLSIIMGEPGSGKTTFAGTFPKPLLYVKLNDDGGDKVLKGVEDVDVLPSIVTDEKFFTSRGKEGSRMIDKLNTLLYELYTTEHGYKTVVIDPFGELAVDMETTLKRLLNKKGLNFDDRSAIQEAIHPVFRRLKMLGGKMNVVLPTHTKSFEKKDTLSNETYTKILPNFTESSSKELCKFADMIGYIGIRNTDGEGETSLVGKGGYERYLIVGANPMLPTKMRLPQGKTLDGEFITDLTYNGLQKVISEL